MAAAVPFAVKAAPFAAGAVASLFGRKASKPSAQQSAAMAGTQRSADQLEQAAYPFVQQGSRDLGDASGYYRGILSGSRSKLEGALAPETGMVMDYYRGAANKMRAGPAGPARTQQMGELDRERVGALSRLVPQARASAAQGLFSTGSTAAGQGMNALATGAYIRNALYSQASDVQRQQQEAGRGWGSFLFDLARSAPWGGGGTGGGRVQPRVQNGWYTF